MPPRINTFIDSKDLLDIEKSLISDSITVGSSVTLSDDSDENYKKVYVYTDINGKPSWVFKERILIGCQSTKVLSTSQTKVVRNTKDPDKMRKNAKDLRPFVENIIKTFQEEKDIEE